MQHLIDSYGYASQIFPELKIIKKVCLVSRLEYSIARWCDTSSLTPLLIEVSVCFPAISHLQFSRGSFDNSSCSLYQSIRGCEGG